MSQLPPGFVLDSAPQGDPVIAPADPYKQAGENRAQRDQVLQEQTTALTNQLTQMQIEQKQREQEEADEKAKALAAAKSGAGNNLRRVIDKIDTVALDSADNNGWFETGLTGSMLRNVPGTAAKDLAANLQTIDANSAFTALQAMRDSSPTGGALGQITERELELLKSTIANLDPSQSQDQFISNLTDAKRAYLDLLERIEPGASEEYNLKPGIRFDEDGTGYLTTVEGPDNRKREDPFGFQSKEPPEPQGGGDSNVMFKGIPGLEGNYSPAALARGFGEGVGDIVEGIGDIIGIGANPIGQTIYSAAGYEQPYDAGQIARDATGLPQSEAGVASTARKAAAGAFGGGALARGVSSVFQPGVTKNVLSTVGRTPVRDAAAGAGAGAGGEVGREVGGTPGQVAGSLLGGFAGYGAANALASASNSARAAGPNALAQAAERQKVDLLPADAGGPAVKAITTGTKASPISVAPVVRQAQKQQEQMAEAAGRAARSQGATPTSDVAGEAVRNAAQRYTKQTSQRGSKLYDRAYDMAKGVKIKPNQTIQAIDAQIERLSENPAAGGLLSQLKDIRGKIEGGVSIRGLRDARTSLSMGVFDGQLRSSADKAILRDVLGSIADDIDQGLRSVGREGAANTFKRADAFWKGRVEHIDEVLQPIIGRDGAKGGETVVEAIESMARGKSGGNARLSRLLANMTDQEAGQVRATIVDRLGRATPGQQGADGTAFSASTFLTNWNRMTPQAKASLFANKQLRSDLNDIAKLAEGMKASQSMANFSNTAVAIGGNAAAGGVLAVTSPIAAMFAGSAQFLTGKLMASPGFARALARTSKMPPEMARRKFSEQLGVLAGREPALAADARALQEHLRQTYSQSPATRAAASEEEQDVRREPPQ